jgi:hypothetical protein
VLFHFSHAHPINHCIVSLTLPSFVKHKGQSTLASDFKGKNMNLL